MIAAQLLGEPEPENIVNSLYIAVQRLVNRHAFEQKNTAPVQQRRLERKSCIDGSQRQRRYDSIRRKPL